MRRTILALPLLLVTSCAETARRDYAHEVLNDVPGGAFNEDAQVA